MRSKASIKGHAIHPALIPFPFAFMTGAFIFDAGGLLLGRESWWTTGMHLAVAGIAGALLAAVPGIIDYIYTVPPKSSGKKRATQHALSNSSAVVLFGIALLLRGSEAPSLIVMALEGIGVVMLGIGGWLGGTLVGRNQISVDPRYAGAGKWKEEEIEPVPGKAAVVAKGDELKVDQMKLLHLDGMRIVIAKAEDEYVAFDDRCTHKGGSLAGGTMICGRVQCPWHGSQFDVHTGEVKAGPATKPIATYELEQSGKEVRLTPPESKG
jgi:nitrite reductase/ring-hydroxylating ferredoxin subunit/uncharacterized membrane protein